MLLVRYLRRLLEEIPELAAAHTSMLDDPAVLIMDFTDPAAVAAELGRCDQFLFLSGKRGALFTSTPSDVWERVHTEQSKAGGARINKISWRQSTRGGHPWVVPQTLLPGQMAAMQGDWAGMVGPARAEIHIQLHGDTVTDPAPWAAVLLERLQAAGLRDVRGQDLGVAPAMGTLTPIPQAAGHWDGGMLLVLPTAAGAEKAATVLNGLCIPGASGSSRVGLRVTHDLEDAAVTSGGARGRAGRGARRAGRPSAT